MGSILELFRNQLTELWVSLLVIGAQIAMLVVAGYMRPNVRHIMLRKPGTGQSLFLIKNFDAHHYHQHMKIEARTDTGAGISRIEVQGGPWCVGVRRVEKPDDHADQIVASFRSLPPDAVFGIRVVAEDPVTLDLAPTSEVQSHRFKQPLVSFRKRLPRWAYFSFRFLLGFLGFLVVQIVASSAIETGPIDSVGYASFDFLLTTGLGLALASGIFALVVPTHGKHAILGYLETRADTQLTTPPRPASAPAPPDIEVRVRKRRFGQRVSA